MPKSDAATQEELDDFNARLPSLVEDIIRPSMNAASAYLQKLGLRPVLQEGQSITDSSGKKPISLLGAKSSLFDLTFDLPKASIRCTLIIIAPPGKARVEVHGADIDGDKPWSEYFHWRSFSVSEMNPKNFNPYLVTVLNVYVRDGHDQDDVDNAG